MSSTISNKNIGLIKKLETTNSLKTLTNIAEKIDLNFIGKNNFCFIDFLLERKNDKILNVKNFVFLLEIFLARGFDLYANQHIIPNILSRAVLHNKKDELEYLIKKIDFTRTRRKFFNSGAEGYFFLDIPFPDLLFLVRDFKNIDLFLSKPDTQHLFHKKSDTENLFNLMKSFVPKNEERVVLERIIEKYIDLGVDINKQMLKYDNLNISMLCLLQNHNENLARKLIAHGADLKLKDKYGGNCLHYVLGFSACKSFSVLLEHFTKKEIYDSFLEDLKSRNLIDQNLKKLPKNIPVLSKDLISDDRQKIISIFEKYMMNKNIKKSNIKIKKNKSSYI